MAHLFQLRPHSACANDLSDKFGAYFAVAQPSRDKDRIFSARRVSGLWPTILIAAYQMTEGERNG